MCWYSIFKIAVLMTLFCGDSDSLILKELAKRPIKNYSGLYVAQCVAFFDRNTIVFGVPKSVFDSDASSDGCQAVERLHKRSRISHEEIPIDEMHEEEFDNIIFNKSDPKRLSLYLTTAEDIPNIIYGFISKSEGHKEALQHLLPFCMQIEKHITRDDIIEVINKNLSFYPNFMELITKENCVFYLMGTNVFIGEKFIFSSMKFYSLMAGRMYDFIYGNIEELPKFICNEIERSIRLKIVDVKDLGMSEEMKRKIYVSTTPRNIEAEELALARIMPFCEVIKLDIGAMEEESL